MQLLHVKEAQDGSSSSVLLVPELNWVTGAPQSYLSLSMYGLDTFNESTSALHKASLKKIELDVLQVDGTLILVDLFINYAVVHVQPIPSFLVIKALPLVLTIYH